MSRTTILAHMAVIACSLVASNYAFQAATGADWSAALERSAFQLVAICCCCMSMLIAAEVAEPPQ